MQFEQSFFKNEVREGFFVSSMMKRAWAAQLEVLDILDKLFRENDLKYFIAYGTLIGAVRHKGFIPWDDDMDIWMPRKDYEKLREMAKNNLLPKDCILKDSRFYKDYEATFPRIINYASIGFDEDRLEKYHGFPFCAGMDIFPLDYVPSGKKLEEFKEDIKVIVQIYSILRVNPKEKLNKRMRELLQMQYGYKIDKKADPINQLAVMYDKCIKKYCPESGDKVTRIYEWVAEGFKDRNLMDSEWFEKTEYLDFENFKAPCPHKYHEVLGAMYDNYMVPARSYDGMHEYPFYKKQDAFFFAVVNQRITSHDYDGDDVANFHAFGEYSDVPKSLSQRVEILIKINDAIINLVETGDAQKLFDFLADSQDVAIKIGSILEERYNEDDVKDIVLDLEKYCENLFHMSEALRGEANDFADLFENNINLAQKIKEDIENLKSDYIKKIAFIFESQKDWDKYSDLYKRLSKENNVRCYAIPIPYYILNSKLKVDSDKLYFDKDEIQSDVEFTDYATFDYESIDCVIKSNPYDNVSYADIIRPFFFSKNIHRFCRKLIHIPTLDIMDFSMEDTQMKEMADCFVKGSGVIYSDYVLLKSKQNAETYAEILKEVSESVDWKKKVKYCPDDEEMAREIMKICME